jgi:hypothetical protein
MLAAIIILAYGLEWPAAAFRNTTTNPTSLTYPFTSGSTNCRPEAIRQGSLKDLNARPPNTQWDRHAW